MSYHWIRASEISNYVYCSQAWWLQRATGAKSQNHLELEEGLRFHQGHGRLLARSTWLQRLAYAMLFFVVALLTFRLLMSLAL